MKTQNSQNVRMTDFIGKRASVRPCECGDSRCPVHTGEDSHHSRRGTVRLYRVDMEDSRGSWYCDKCAKDALDSGVFSTERNFYS